MNYGKYEGQLCRMLEEPVPLTPDAEMPCLTRLIQDDSRMGMFNRDTKPSRLSDFYLVARIVSNNIVVDEFMESDYNRFEIIGTPVAEGSEDWAWYQMMQGEKINHAELSSQRFYANKKERFYAIKKGCDYCAFYENDGNEVCTSPISKRTRRTYGEFIEYSKSWGILSWQIYKEPKPLLAKAKVGDLCQRRDGKWVQIDRLLSIGGMPWICYEIGGLRYINNGEQLNSKLSELGIISTEPLAPEGTAEWAWQMLMLQKPVSHPAEGEFQDTYYTKEGFVRCMAKTGWQLYEPKQEPESQYKVGDWLEFIDAGGRKSQGKYLSKAYDNAILVLDITYNMRCVVPVTKIIRKLSPSEVVIHIGCLSGTVEDLSYAESGRFWLIGKATERCQQGMFVLLYDEMLDTPTSNLVESLLKAQEVKK